MCKEGKGAKCIIGLTPKHLNFLNHEQVSCVLPVLFKIPKTYPCKYVSINPHSISAALKYEVHPESSICTNSTCQINLPHTLITH